MVFFHNYLRDSQRRKEHLSASSEMKPFVLIASLGAVQAQQQGTKIVEDPTSILFNYQDCSILNQDCSLKNKALTIDANWRWVLDESNNKNCYTGNEWDEDICTDPQTCASKCYLVRCPVLFRLTSCMLIEEPANLIHSLLLA